MRIMRGLRGPVVGAVVAGALLAGAPAAVATESGPDRAAGYDCPDGARGCLWDGRGGDGDVFVVTECGEYDLPPEWRDRVSSYQIVSAFELALYDYVDDEPEFMESLSGNGGPPGQGAPLGSDGDRTDRIEVTC
jgi:hypothetical protein